jgi:hypothetical protein
LSPRRSDGDPGLGNRKAANPRYLVASDRRRVEGWSNVRLPFMPTGDSLAFREALREAIKSLEPRPNEILHAVYQSALTDRVDLDNVLLYNVGAGAFGRLARHGLSLEQVVALPPVNESSLAAAHYHVYEPAPLRHDWSQWRAVAEVASFGPTVLPAVSEFTKPVLIWLSLRRGVITGGSHPKASAALGIQLTVEIPPAGAPNLAAIVKPLVDGVIAALHVDEHPNGECVRRLAIQAGTSESEIRQLLTENSAAVLGARRLVWLRANGVQWNPADDQLAAIRLTRSTKNQSGRWLMTGRLVELRP